VAKRFGKSIETIGRALQHPEPEAKEAAPETKFCVRTRFSTQAVVVCNALYDHLFKEASGS